MVQKSIAEIVADVKICIDEIGLNEAEFVSSDDNIDMDTIIVKNVSDALRFVNLHADASYLEPSVKYETLQSDAKGVVEYVLPVGFLRLCYATLEGWLHPVTELIFYTDKEYAMLKNPITTGYPDNPKIAIVEKAIEKEGTYEIKKVLELYSTTESQVSMTLGYIEDSDLDEEYNCSIPDKLYRSVVYYTAGLTLMTYKDAHADTLLNMALTMMGANQK